MAYLLFFIALLVGAYLAWPVLQKANPAQIVRGGALTLLILSSAVAVFALATGRPQWVIVALIVWLISLISRLATPATGRPSAGRGWGRGGTGTSSIDTRYLKLTLDHASGRVTGDILAGRHAGRRVETMTADEVVDVLREAAADDPQTAQLLEAYLDRIDPGWRAKTAGGGQERGPGGRIRMSRAEALGLLGLADDATEADIRAAHRKLMREHHPDRGGTAEFAAKLNEAKEVLLGTR